MDTRSGASDRRKRPGRIRRDAPGCDRGILAGRDHRHGSARRRHQLESGCRGNVRLPQRRDDRHLNPRDPPCGSAARGRRDPADDRPRGPGRPVRNGALRQGWPPDRGFHLGVADQGRDGRDRRRFQEFTRHFGTAATRTRCAAVVASLLRLEPDQPDHRLETHARGAAAEYLPDPGRKRRLCAGLDRLVRPRNAHACADRGQRRRPRICARRSRLRR